MTNPSKRRDGNTRLMDSAVRSSQFAVRSSPCSGYTEQGATVLNRRFRPQQGAPGLRIPGRNQSQIYGETMTENTKTAISHQPLLQTEDRAMGHDKRRVRTICKQCQNGNTYRKKRIPRHPVVERRASGIRLNIHYHGKRYRITLCLPQTEDSITGTGSLHRSILKEITNNTAGLTGHCSDSGKSGHCQRTRCKPCARTAGDHDNHSTRTPTLTGMTGEAFTTPERRRPASNSPSHYQG
ncbi:Arm DNA-binding domain-containing protein [Kistimonas scapharcae]|uniref:Arm DNA-binding domain-containing protein n=1 Tax=Kistimonas scapharcae TaxID=1036133 RepID=UPI0031EE44A9